MRHIPVTIFTNGTNITIVEGNMYGASSQNPERQNESQYRQLPAEQGKYPVEVFPAIIRQAVIDVDAKLGGGIELAASAALGVVSTACQEFINVQRPTLKPSSCSLFLVTIAGTGAGKTEIQNCFMTELETFERAEESRASAAPDGSEKLSRKSRMERLGELRQSEYELLAGYDDLRRKESDLRKRIEYLNEVLSGRSRAVEVRGKRPEAPEKGIAAANRTLESLLPRLKELQFRLAEIQVDIGNTMGPAARRLVYGRGSFAGFRNGLQDKCRSAGIISAEAGGIFNSQLVTRNMDAWNDLWGCEFYRETYDKREYVIESPRLTLALMLQPKQFEKFIDNYGENALDNGFLSRTLLLKVPSYAPKTVGGTDDAPREIESLERFHQRTRDILSQPFPWIPERIVLTFSTAARRYWESYYNTLSFAIAAKDRFDPEMEGFVRKLPEQAARFAGLFHYFETYPIRNGTDSGSATDAYGGTARKGREREIPLETVQAAVQLCDWYMAEFKRLIISSELPEPFSNFVYSTQVRTNADKILKTIERHYRKYEQEQGSACIRLEYRHIQNANRTIRNRGDILAALHCLSDDKKVHLGRGKKGGYFICYNRSGQHCGRCFTETIYSSPTVRLSNLAVSAPISLYPTATPSFVSVFQSPGLAQASASQRKPGGASAPGEQTVQANPDRNTGTKKSYIDSFYSPRPGILASALRVLSGEDEKTKEASSSSDHHSSIHPSNEEEPLPPTDFPLPDDQIQKAARDSIYGNHDEDDESLGASGEEI